MSPVRDEETGFPHLLESPGFLYIKFPGPLKSWKMGLILESPGNFYERFWKVLELSGLCARGGHRDAGADAKICKN